MITFSHESEVVKVQTARVPFVDISCFISDIYMYV